MIQGPTLQPLGRSAWDGRLAEAYGSDLYLSGVMVAEFLEGGDRIRRELSQLQSNLF